MSDTREVTTVEKAAPMMRPKATSRTLSRPRNAGERGFSHFQERQRDYTREILVEPFGSSPDTSFRLEECFLNVVQNVIHSDLRSQIPVCRWYLTDWDWDDLPGGGSFHYDTPRAAPQTSIWLIPSLCISGVPRARFRWGKTPNSTEILHHNHSAIVTSSYIRLRLS